MPIITGPPMRESKGKDSQTCRKISSTNQTGNYFPLKLEILAKAKISETKPVLLLREKNIGSLNKKNRPGATTRYFFLGVESYWIESPSCKPREPFIVK
jgi:hypothetical protein